MGKAAYDLWQHFAQPAASLQQAAQVALSLQQPPVQAVAGLQLDVSFLQHEAHPVLKSNPAAQITANVRIFIIIRAMACFAIALSIVIRPKRSRRFRPVGTLDADIESKTCLLRDLCYR